MPWAIRCSLADFYRELAGALPAEAQNVVSTVMAETGNSAFARDWVRARVAGRPELRWPLTLWGRRLLGEAITIHIQPTVCEIATRHVGAGCGRTRHPDVNILYLRELRT